MRLVVVTGLYDFISNVVVIKNHFVHNYFPDYFNKVPSEHFSRKKCAPEDGALSRGTSTESARLKAF